MAEGDIDEGQCGRPMSYVESGGRKEKSDRKKEKKVKDRRKQKKNEKKKKEMKTEKEYRKRRRKVK